MSPVPEVKAIAVTPVLLPIVIVLAAAAVPTLIAWASASSPILIAPPVEFIATPVAASTVTPPADDVNAIAPEAVPASLRPVRRLLPRS